MSEKMKKIFLPLLILAFGLVGYNVQAQEENSSNELNVAQHYQLDSDGDGVIDMFDKQPTKWNVSDRDLRFFMELAYRSNEELIAIFSGDEAMINRFNQEKLLGAADVRELTQHWHYELQMNEDDGFSASFFSNGSQVVVAFRGTNDGADYDDDTRLFMALQPGQVRNLKEVLGIIAPYSEYYLTGHSLGGYLAQYLASRDLIGNPKYVHSAIFNTPGISASFFSGVEHWQTAKNKDLLVRIRMINDVDSRHVFDTYKSQPYGIHGDSIAGYTMYANTRWLNQVNSGSKHSSTNFVATRFNEALKEHFTVGYRMDKIYEALDSDGDGLKDREELHLGTDPKKVDSDADGYDDYVELLHNTLPFDVTSY